MKNPLKRLKKPKSLHDIPNHVLICTECGESLVNCKCVNNEISKIE